MKITAIKQQVKQANRFSVFVDDKYAFSLSDGALLGGQLFVGKELDASEVARLKQASSDDKLYGMALRYAAMCPRSEWEMRTYLERKHSPAPLSDKILNKLSDLDLLNDLAFARSWIANRRLLKFPSRRKILQELRAKHVSEAIIGEALGEDEINDRTVLRELIAKKRQLPRYQDNLKLMQYLARQGFSYDDIKSELAAED